MIVLVNTKKMFIVISNNHTTVWGSWWKDHQWGYKCYKQFVRNSYCTGAASIGAAEAPADLMKSNIARKEATKGGQEEERIKTREKYNVKWNDNVTVEDMKAYRMKRVRDDDS